MTESNHRCINCKSPQKDEGHFVKQINKKNYYEITYKCGSKLCIEFTGMSWNNIWTILCDKKRE